MRFKAALVIISSLISLSSCSDMKSIEYGNLMFKTEYDGLLHTDRLWLYDNGVFKIDMPNLEANGTFRISGDTILLDYYRFEGTFYQAFVIEGNNVYELEMNGSNWILSKRDSFMGIDLNETTGYNKL